MNDFIDESNYLSLGFAIFKKRCYFLRQFMLKDDYKDISQIIQEVYFSIEKPATKRDFIRLLRKEFYQFGKAIGVHKTRRGIEKY